MALTTNAVNAVNTFQTRNLNANYQPASKDFTRYPSLPQTISTRVFVQIVANDGATIIDKFDEFDEESVNYITSYQQLYEQVYDSNYDSDPDNYVAAISCDFANQLEPLNAKIQFGEVQANAMIDSGSVVSLITKTLANRILRTTLSAIWITTKERRDLKTFSNEPIKFPGHLETTVTYNNWTCKDARLTILENGHKIIIGRDLFNSLGLAIVQQQ